MHRHAPSEVYHVLEGELAFYVGDEDGAVERVAVRAGQVMPLAGGTPHTIRNESDELAVAFGVHAPGAAMEGFSRAAAELAARRASRRCRPCWRSPSSTASSCSDRCRNRSRGDNDPGRR